MSVLDWILSILMGFFAIPIAFLLVETLASLLPFRPRTNFGTRIPCVVLIPAHNEELGIASTLDRLRDELQPGDRVVVVADNCTDATASIARNHGVEVVERSHETERGKGFALEAGLNYLAPSPPDIVVILDADCRFAPGNLGELVSVAHARARPVQAVYLPGVRDDGSLRSRVATFALGFKNQARPTGLYHLGLPCLLTGSGIALPWRDVRSVSWGTGSIVEDMRLGIDLAVRGDGPEFCPGAKVISDAPPSDRASIKQRTRWEHGHVATIVTQAPRLLVQAVVQFRPRLFFLALELSVPPLSLLVFGLIASSCLNGLNWQFMEGSEVPLLGSLLCWATLTLTIFLAWGKFGRGTVPIGSLLLLPLYLVWKLPIYLRLVGRRERNWVRTDRANS